MPRFLVRDFGSCLSFNGSTAYVYKASNSVFGTTGYSIECWVKVNNPTSNYAIYSEGDSSTNIGFFYFRVSNTTKKSILVSLQNDAGTNLINGVEAKLQIANGNWHHIVWTDNNGICALYVNSILDSTNYNYTPTGTFSFNRTSVGCLYRTGASTFYNGEIDQVRTYTSVLTQDQVTALYYTGSVPITPYFEWLFNDNTGTTASDTSGNNRPGTLTGSTLPQWVTDPVSNPRTLATGRALATGRTLATNRTIVT